MYRNLAFALGSALAPGNTWLAQPSDRIGEGAHARSPTALLHLLYLSGTFKARSLVNFPVYLEDRSKERQESLKPPVALPLVYITLDRLL